MGPPEGSGPNPAQSRANLKAGHAAQRQPRRGSSISKDETSRLCREEQPHPLGLGGKISLSQHKMEFPCPNWPFPAAGMKGTMQKL